MSPSSELSLKTEAVEAEMEMKLLRAWSVSTSWDSSSSWRNTPSSSEVSVGVFWKSLESVMVGLVVIAELLVFKWRVGGRNGEVDVAETGTLPNSWVFGDAG